LSDEVGNHREVRADLIPRCFDGAGLVPVDHHAYT